MPLDDANTDPAYLCGRLLSVLEAAELAATGRRDWYYAKARVAAHDPMVAVTQGVNACPSWLTKIATRSGEEAARHVADRIGALVDRIGSPDPHPVGPDATAAASLGYGHQEAADVRAGLRPDLRVDVTTSEVAAMLGYTGEAAVRSAAKWLHRHGVRPVGREPGRIGQNLYDEAVVRSALDDAPGRGRRTDLARTEVD